MSNKTQLQTNNAELASLIDALQGKSVPGGGSGGGIEYEVVISNEQNTSIPFTLKRITHTFGSYSGDSGNETGGTSCGAQTVSSHVGLRRYSYYAQGSSSNAFVIDLFIEDGNLNSGVKFAVPYTAIFINDPSQPALYEGEQ